MEKLIVFIIILIFSGIGKLIQKHNEQKQLESLRRLQQEQGPQRGQSELDAFLRGRKAEPEVEVEVLDDADFEPASQPARQSRREPARPAPAQIAPVRPGGQQGNRTQQNRPQQGNQNRSQQQQQKKQKKNNKPNTQNRPGKSQPQSQQSAQRRPLGEGVRQHVEQHIRHLDTEVDDHVRMDIVDSVNSHLGQFSGEDTGTRPGNPTAARLVASLRSPEGVRQAMLINEILSRPRVLRR